MKRKVIQIAGSTQLISLPRKWAVKNGIEKGDELEITEKSDQLLISKNSQTKAEKKGEIHFTTPESFLARALEIKYRLGYTEIWVYFEHPGVVPLVQQQLRKLLGFELVHQTSQYCIIKNVAEPINNELDTVLRRLFLTVLSFGKEALEAVQEGNPETIQNVINMERTVNKLAFFCQRILNTQGHTDKEKTCTFYQIVGMLEQVGDAMKRVCASSIKKQKKLSKATLELLNQSMKNFEEFYTLFYKYDLMKLVKLKKNGLSTQKAGIELLSVQKNNEASAEVIHHILTINEITYEMSMNLAQ